MFKKLEKRYTNIENQKWDSGFSPRVAKVIAVMVYSLTIAIVFGMMFFGMVAIFENDMKLLLLSLLIGFSGLLGMGYGVNLSRKRSRRKPEKSLTHNPHGKDAASDSISWGFG